MSERLLVVGGGPTGLATAILGARAGFEAVVIEPEQGTIDKACGEGLMPAGVAALARLGVDARAIGRPFRGIRYVDGPWVADADFADGTGVGIRRLALHQALRAQAEAAGVRWQPGRLKGLSQSGDGVELELASGAQLTGDWLIGADGLRSTVRRVLGWDRPPRGPQRIGLRRHFECAPWSDRVEVHWSPSAEAYVTPVSENTVGIAMLVTGRVPEGGGQTPFERLLALFPALQAQLAGAAPASHVRGAGPFETRVARRAKGRVLLVGDAAGYLDPITGEGLKLGFLAAEAAIEAVLLRSPERYERQWRRITRRYYLATGGLLALTRRPLLRRAMVPVLSRAPWIMGGVLRVLG